MLTSNAAYDVQAGVISAILGGSAGLTKSGAGSSIVTLSGSNSYTGDTAVNAGTLAYGANDAISNSSHVVVNGGTLAIATYSDTVAGMQLLGGTITGSTGTLTSTSAFDVQAGTIGAILGGSAGLTKNGSGTVNLTGHNTYTGTTTVNEGTLRIGASNVFSDSSSLVVNGGIFSIYGFSDTVAGVQLLGGTISSSAGVLTSTSTYDVQSGAVNARLGGSVGLTKSGIGIVTLSAINRYNGTTTVNYGTLAYGVNSALSDSSHVLVNSGTLSMNGYSDTVAGVQLLDHGSITGDGSTLASTSTFDVQSGVISAKLGGSVGLKKSGSGTVVLSGHNAYTGDTLIEEGALALTGDGQIDLLSAIDNRDTFVIGDGSHALGNIIGNGDTYVGSSAHLTAKSIVQDTLTIGGDYRSILASAPHAAVPEPGTLVLLATLGFILALTYFRKKR